MFFLFSDMLLMAKPRPALHLLQRGTFICRALYPMAQCQLHKVFGHSGGPCGGLLNVSKKGVLGKVGEASDTYAPFYLFGLGPFHRK